MVLKEIYFETNFERDLVKVICLFLESNINRVLRYWDWEINLKKEKQINGEVSLTSEKFLYYPCDKCANSFLNYRISRGISFSEDKVDTFHTTISIIVDAASYNSGNAGLITVSDEKLRPSCIAYATYVWCFTYNRTP